MRATRRERIEAAVGGRVLGNWRSWLQTADGFRRVADSASATSAAGRVHGSLPIFGVNAVYKAVRRLPNDSLHTSFRGSAYPAKRRNVNTTASRRIPPREP